MISLEVVGWKEHETPHFTIIMIRVTMLMTTAIQLEAGHRFGSSFIFMLQKLHSTLEV